MGRRRASNVGLPRRMRFQHGTYYYDHGPHPETGRRRWQRLSRNLAEAKLKWAQIEAEETRAPDGSFASASALYRIRELPKLSLAEQSNRVRLLDSADLTFGRMPLTDIRTHHVQRAMELIAARNAANKFVTAVSGVLAFAIRQGIGDITDNPCRYVKMHSIAARDRCPAPDEFVAVYQIALEKYPALAESMIWALLTGWDLGQIIRFRKEQASEEGIRYKRRKTRKQPRAQERILEWNDHLKGCFSRLVAMHPHPWCEFVVINRKGQPYTESGFKSMWQRTIRRALEERKIAERFWFRDIRAMAGTLAEEQGNSAQELLAHLTERQTVDYIRSKQPKRVRANTLPWKKL